MWILNAFRSIMIQLQQGSFCNSFLNCYCKICTIIIWIAFQNITIVYNIAFAKVWQDKLRSASPKAKLLFWTYHLSNELFVNFISTLHICRDDMKHLFFKFQTFVNAERCVPWRPDFGIKPSKPTHGGIAFECKLFNAFRTNYYSTSATPRSGIDFKIATAK